MSWHAPAAQKSGVADKRRPAAGQAEVEQILANVEIGHFNFDEFDFLLWSNNHFLFHNIPLQQPDMRRRGCTSLVEKTRPTARQAQAEKILPKVEVGYFDFDDFRIFLLGGKSYRHLQHPILSVVSRISGQSVIAP